MHKLIRITTVPQSLNGLLKGQLHFINKFFDVIAISSPGKEIEEVSKNEQVTVIPVNMTRTISPLKDLVAVWKLYRIFRREKPHIVHTHTPKAGTLGMIAAKLARVPYRLHTVAGMPLLVAKGKRRKLLDFVEKLTYKCATKIYPNSFGLRDIIVSGKYAPSCKVHVIGNGSSNGIDTDYFSPTSISLEALLHLKDKLDIKKGDLVFCFIGRLVKDKGINELVNAFQRVSREYPEAKLLLVGRYERELDPLSFETESLISDSPSIIYVGFQKDVRPYLLISDVLTFPSYREGFPNVVMQAGSLEKPAIVTDINGCNEIIRNNVNGIIIPVADADALYREMKDLAKNRIKIADMATSCRKIIVESYERKFVWEEILAEYRKYV